MTAPETTSIGPMAYTAPQRRLSMVLVAQLRNFGALSETVAPFEVMRTIDRFATMVANRAHGFGGETMVLHNDTVIVVFRKGQPPQTAQQAVRAAQAVQLAFAPLAEEWKSGYGMQTAVSMGLHLGELVYGLVGPASAQRETAWGDALIVGERLADRARAGEFVLSDSVMGALEVARLDLDAEPLPMLRLPHRQDIRIFGVLLDTRLDFTAESPPSADVETTVPSVITTRL